MHCSSVPKCDYSHASQGNHVRVAKREREGQAGTSQNPKPQNNPTRKQAIKVGKGKDEVIVHSGSDEDTATVATSETSGSSKGKSSEVR